MTMWLLWRLVSDDVFFFQKNGRHEPFGNGGFLEEQPLLYCQAGKGWLVACLTLIDWSIETLIWLKCLSD